MIGAACACPFYGAALFVTREPDAMVTSFPTMGNQCALITSSHSPCWMEVGENAAPDWAQCPRNPEFVAACAHNLEGHVRTGDRRLLACARDLAMLMQDRDAVGAELTPGSS